MSTDPQMASRSASVADDEIERFSQHADDWWNTDGVFRPLHRLNPTRLSYIRARVEAHFFNHEKAAAERQALLKGLAVLDVGCGGGILTEPLARLGGDVTGLDASDAAIKTARAHAKAGGLSIHYQASTVELLAEGSTRYDLITALEIVEHVADLSSFIGALSRLLKPGGLLILSTLNRTPKSFLLGIAAAEYILRWVPKGTHSWKKFIRPSELILELNNHELDALDLTGVIFNPFTNAFELSRTRIAVNYMVTASRAGA